MNKSQKQDQSVSQRDKKVKRVKQHQEGSSQSALSNINIDSFQLEEEEAMKRKPEEDHLLFTKTCNELREHLHEILKLKKSKGNGEDINEHRVESYMLFLLLKKLNRLDKHRCKKARDDVNERKQKVDNFHLQLQNLLYEVMHLQKEVTKCLEFRSKDEEIELVPVEEFYKDAPEKIARSEKTKHDAHELTLARLEWELEQRKRFAVKLKEAEQTKEKYQLKIRKKKECLDNIQPTLISILEATEPLQSKLGMPLQATQLQHKTADFLPKPLYVLYVQACAYREACDKKVHISVEGNVDEAKILQLKVEEVAEDSGESDQEEIISTIRHRHSVSDKRQDTSMNILSKHPLSVCLTVEGGEGRICVEFFYLFHLRIVTACVKTLSPQPSAGVSANDLLKLESFLGCLFPGDYGKESPNPSNYYQLQKVENETAPFSNAGTGCPYIWAQRLAGLEFLSVSETDCQNSDAKQLYKVSASSMEKTVCAIRSRLLARIALYNQLLMLEHGTTNIPPDVTSMYPSKVVAQLKKWVNSSWEDVQNHPSSSELLELNLINDDAVVFKAVIERGSACLTALVVVFPDYPTAAPLFLLSLRWKANKTSASNDALREIEEEVNVHCVEMMPPNSLNNLLICQMHHLLVAFDVFLETEISGDTLEGPREFSQGKVVARTARGRNHSRPYKYIPKLCIFTQR